jgi:beta-N-acetylhexosaminidase
MTTVPFKARKVRSCAAGALAVLALGGCGHVGPRAIVATGPLPPGGEPSLGLPLETAVAQLFAVGFAGTTPTAPMVGKLRGRDWGVVVLDRTNAVAPLQAQVLAKSLRRAGARGGRPVPLVLAAEPAAFPGVAMTPQPDLSEPPVVFREARTAALVLRAAGVGAALAPTADLAVAAGPAESTAFSADPVEAARLTEAAQRGWRAGGVAPVLGHFPGQGGASRDPEEGTATVGLSLGELHRRDEVPFEGVADEVPAMQVSNALYAAWDGVTPASLLPDAYKLLRRDGFAGCAMSGDLVAATAATGGSVGRAALDAVLAGADLLYIPGDAGNQEEAYRAVLAAARSGRLSHARLADALLHVSALKRDWARPPA